MPPIGEQTGGKSPGELVAEAFWFFAHTFISLAVYAALVIAIQMVRPESFSQLLATVMAFTVPAIAGYIIALIWPNEIARYVWIFGLIWFSIVCVYVLDLPTGPRWTNYGRRWSRSIIPAASSTAAAMPSEHGRRWPTSATRWAQSLV